MKYVSVSVLSLLIIICTATARPSGSLLTPTPFPKTTDDLTFRQRIDVLTAGYEDFDTVFDSNGACIKNCPYVGITIKDFEKQLHQAAAKVQQDLNQIPQNPDTSSPANPTSPNAPTPPNAPAPGNVPPAPTVPPQGDAPSPVPPVPPSTSNMPITCPLSVNPVRVTDEWRWRTRKRYHHGVDIDVVVGTTVRAAADGRVVIRKNEGNKKGFGNYLVIQHANGYYTVYGHLSQWLVNLGDTVTAGQPIAKSGNTGNSSGAHLHFEVLTGAPLARLGAQSVNPRTITRCPWSPKNNSVNANPEPH